MRKLVLPALLTLASVGSVWHFRSVLFFKTEARSVVPNSEATLHKLRLQARDARTFTAKKKYNTNFCFLIDMKPHAGKNRFFIYNLAGDSVETAGLVTHGRCNENWLEGRRYSNVPGCGCTSLGKYKIGSPYMGRFGLAYKLYGLESSNNNAFARFVVLHAHSCVPKKEIFPSELCQSDGCPTVSPELLQQLAKKINGSEKPVLLWIYE